MGVLGDSALEGVELELSFEGKKKDSSSEMGTIN